MKLVQHLLVLGSIALAGCTVMAPRNQPSVTLVGVHSPSVVVEPPSLIEHGTTSVLKGFVYRQRHAETTRGTDLEIIFLDANGQSLHNATINFRPQSLPRDVRVPRKRGRYTLSIENLPPKTTRIEVRARDRNGQVP